MKIPKKAPIKKERKFIKLHDEFNDVKEKLELTKEELRILFSKGYDFTLIRFKPGSQFSPPWRKLCDELLKKYMNPAQSKEWHRRVAKRYPRTTIAPTIEVLKEGEPTT
jgi:hypothetical protein